MDYRNANYRNVGYDKKNNIYCQSRKFARLIVIQKQISPGAAWANCRRPGCGKGYYLLHKVPQKMERLKRDEINQ